MIAKLRMKGLIVAVFVLASGCSYVKQTEAPNEAVELLDVGIAAIDNGSQCEADEFSTEDEEVIHVLRARNFEVVAYEVKESDEGILHHFILAQQDSGLLLSASIVAIDGRCSTYAFARIAQS